MVKSRTCGKAKAKAGKGKGACSKDIKFASSKKSKLFIRSRMEGKNVKAVGGIHRALGRRLEDAGFGCAAKLSCKVKKMTKRKFMRYMLKTAGGNVRHAMDSYVSMTNHCRKVKDCKCGRRR